MKNSRNEKSCDLDEIYKIFLHIILLFSITFFFFALSDS